MIDAGIAHRTIMNQLVACIFLKTFHADQQSSMPADPYFFLSAKGTDVNTMLQTIIIRSSCYSLLFCFVS